MVFIKKAEDHKGREVEKRGPCALSQGKEGRVHYRREKRAVCTVAGKRGPCALSEGKEGRVHCRGEKRAVCTVGGKRGPCALSEGMLSGDACYGEQLEFPENTKNRATLGSSSPTAEHTPQRKEIRISKTYLHIPIHCSTIHNGQDLESTSVPINRRTDKKNVVCRHSGYYSAREERNRVISAAWMSLEELGKSARCRKTNTPGSHSYVGAKKADLEAVVMDWWLPESEEGLRVRARQENKL
ncbi:uncharacterized protein LOC129041670 [Pongo pygmaeus]|uniref:uncharacterized protein LOC129041670 n=1 Tax=Pongo pygmaeus TaxID=9600 RepID=UPI0023E0CB33|nr:uncharacterized protein LOC129041670 [Pongo pygmaeus]